MLMRLGKDYRLKRHAVRLGFIFVFVLIFTQFYRISKIKIRYTNEIKSEWQVYTTGQSDSDTFTTAGFHAPSTVEECRMTQENRNQTRKWYWSPGYRNPCWKDSSFHCAPYFFVTGFPKCGTTDLFERMAYHPNFIKPLFKEIHWITRYRFLPHRHDKNPSQSVPTPVRDLQHGLSEYLSVFKPLTLQNKECSQSFESTNKFQNVGRQVSSCGNKITGDFSPSTMWDSDMYMNLPINRGRSEPVYTAADFIYDMNPCAKLIVMMRNPVSRIYSDYLHFYINKSPEDFHRIVKRTIDLYTKCFAYNTPRQCISDFNIERRGGARIRQGIYYLFILDWLERFPRDHFLFMRLEDYANNTAYHMNQVFNFLEMGSLEPDQMEAIITAEPSNTRQGRSSDVNAPPMMLKTRMLLQKFYAPFNDKLSKILSDEKYLWKQ